MSGRVGKERYFLIDFVHFLDLLKTSKNHQNNFLNVSRKFQKFFSPVRSFRKDQKGLLTTPNLEKESVQDLLIFLKLHLTPANFNPLHSPTFFLSLLTSNSDTLCIVALLG